MKFTIRRLYFLCAFIGGLATIVFVYQNRLNYLTERGSDSGAFDPVVLMWALGLSILFVPIGVLLGLSVALALHFGWLARTGKL